MAQNRLLIGVLGVAALTLSACDSGSTGGGANDPIRAVGSSTVLPFAKKVAEDFARSNTQFSSPIIESTGTGGGFREFCKGAGPSFPDIANASRRIKVSEFDTCAENGVTEIIELQVGLDGIAFASAQGGIELNLTPKIVYEALAANPYGGEQTNETWADVDPSLPDMPILVYGPPSTSGTRDALKELVLEVGCDSNPEMEALKEEDEDRHQAVCTEVRADGKFVDQGEQDNLIVQKIEGNPNSIGIFGYSYLEENADKVQGLSMNGVDPTYENISSFAYPGARPLYVYVKKAHFTLKPGLAEFLQQWVVSWDVGGPLASIGMVASPPAEMELNTRRVNEQIALTRAELTGEAPAEEAAEPEMADAEG